MITKATISEHNRLSEIWENAVKATHSFLKIEDFNFYKTHISEYFTHLDVYTYKDNMGVIQGFLGVDKNKIEMLFINNQERGQGIGKKLLDFAIHRLNATQVDVNEQNAQAVGFYEHMGFTCIGRSETDGEGKNYPILHLKLIQSQN